MMDQGSDYDLTPTCFADMRADDGYRAEARESHGVEQALEVWLNMKTGGEVIYARRVWQRKAGTLQTEDYGEQRRVLLVWQAIASFLNAGGNIRALEVSLMIASRDDDFPEWLWPPGYILIDTTHVLEGPQHIIGNLETLDAVVWTEDQGVVMSTLDVLAGKDTDESAAAPPPSTLWAPAEGESSGDFQAETSDC